MKKNKNLTVLRPVKIFIDDLEKIFEIIYSKYKESEVIIETENFFYYNFEELTRSPEDFIYALKIKINNNNKFEINFEDGIYIKSENKNDKSLILKIKNILSNNELIKNFFLYFFTKHNRYFYIIFSLLFPLILFLSLKKFEDYRFLFSIFLIFYSIVYLSFIKNNYRKFLYSTIILRKKSIFQKRELQSKEKKVPKIIIITSIIGLLIPFLLFLLNFVLQK